MTHPQYYSMIVVCIAVVSPFQEGSSSVFENPGDEKPPSTRRVGAHLGYSANCFRIRLCYVQALDQPVNVQIRAQMISLEMEAPRAAIMILLSYCAIGSVTVYILRD